MKRRLLSVLILAVLSLSFVLPDVPYLSALTVTAEAAAAVSAPKADVKSGTYSLSTSTMKVKLSCSEKNATIYYSLNGAAYKKYSASSPVKIKRNSTLKVYSKTSSGKSKVVTYSYKLKPKTYIDSTETKDGVALIITVKPSGNEKIYYTTDGSTPTTSSKVYSGGFLNISKSCRLNMLVKKSNWTASYPYYDVKLGGGSTSTSTSSNVTSYTSPKTGNTFEVPAEGYAKIKYGNLIQSADKTVPAEYRSNNPTTYVPYDRVLSIHLDGFGKGSLEYLFFNITSGNVWKTGAEYTLDDLGSDENYIGINGIYMYYMQYLGKYSTSVYTKFNPEYFEDAYLKVLDLDSSGKHLTVYFYVKSHDDWLYYVWEGVANLELDGKIPDSVTSGSTGTGTGTGTGIPSTGSSQKCAVCSGSGICSPCNGTGKVWGWKQKVTCYTCHGTGKCPYCKSGYVYY